MTVHDLLQKVQRLRCFAKLNSGSSFPLVELARPSQGLEWQFGTTFGRHGGVPCVSPIHVHCVSQGTAPSRAPVFTYSHRQETALPV